ncbi:hypothetical protein H6F77_20585 [Microcoleus sp. FACHB-831]|nr:hypothetical protein [Microcoleus sp. FACHB-831]MBD1923447.1 hypothetical protein [Microcoleus sp. FACHB-831]
MGDAHQKLLYRLDGHNESVLSVGFSLDGENLCSGSADGTIKMWGVR